MLMSTRNRVLIAGELAALLLAPVQPYANESHYGVVVETANAYNSCGGSDLSNSNQSGDAFLSQLTSVNDLGFSLFAHWQDGNTWDTDFLDPDTPGANSHDDDTHNFDQPNLAISFFQGHGLQTDKPNPDKVCTSGDQCTSPPSGASVGNLGTGACVLSPGSVAKYGADNGVCQYRDARAMATCGSGDANGHFAFLSPNMALGENPTNGAWRGAGINGGTSLAIVNMSFGMLTFFPSEWSNIFAGLHLYEGIMISWGDEDDPVGFGNAVASPYTVNPSSSVSQGYLNAISSVTGGGGCGGATSWGGGINGCGCHAAMTLSHSAAGAADVFNENWFSLKNDNSAQNGVGFWEWGIMCNYNPAAYPWSGGDHR
jgi:hypothetical protein